MRLKLIALSVLILALILPDLQAFAQRGGRGGGGRGGGGMQRGGGAGGMQRGGGAGGMQRGGGGAGSGFGGGLSSRSPQGGGLSSRSPQGGSPSMGPYGRGASGGQGMGMGAGSAGRPGMGAGSAGRPGMGAGGAGQAGAVGAGRPGLGAGGVGQAGIGAGGADRPGLGAGGAGRPGVGTGGAGGAASGAGTLPGVGVGRPGVGAGGVGGPDSGVGIRPGVGAGAAGAPGGYGADRGYGTYYAGNNALVAQRNTVVAGASGYPAYNPAMYAGAWQAANMANSSYYANPGYGAVASMLGMAAQPVVYDYGSNVVVQPSAVYVNGDPAGTPQEYADQAGQIATSGAAEPAPDAEWLPLGVFAMVEGDQAQPNDQFQLAVSRQGVLRGNYHNVQTNETTPLVGSVDLKSQRAAWTIGGDQSPVYEAGIASLTQDQTTMIVHTPDGQQRQFTLVRLPEPQGADLGTSSQ